MRERKLASGGVGAVLLLEVERQRTDGEVDAMKLLAWLRTIEDGIHTPDIFKEGTSKKRVGTKEFTKEVIARLGDKPVKLAPMGLSAPLRERAKELVALEKWSPPPQEKVLHGVDVFLEWRGSTPDALSSIRSAVEFRFNAGNGMQGAPMADSRIARSKQ
jgi:hypothetical protein